LESDHIQRFDPTDFFLSLVPTQLHRLLDHPRLIPWLAQFKTIMVGGSPCWSDLLAKARSHQLPLALTYGMTETAAQICALKPEEFLQGNTSCGHILPHVQVALLPQEDPQDRADPVGQIVIQSTALALGYYPNLWENPTLVTGDIGRLDNQNQLYILGRKDDLIMTGGEKVFAHEIETVIRSVQGVADVCVMGLPDPEWGQKIGAAYVCMDATLSIEALDRVLQRRLSPYKRPKHWLRLDQLPRNGQGKINREKIRHWLMQEAAKDQSTAE
jgi:O-succinylbenzoic acid--CoA ligase